MKRILVVEDNTDIAFLVAIHLRDSGAMVDVVHDGNEGLSKAMALPYDLLILDIMLPGKDGLDVCRELRKRSYNMPILMLTAKSSEMDRILGLELGADDYLTKPFSVGELVARTKAIFRRIDSLREAENTEYEVFKAGNLEIDRTRHHVRLESRSVDLTAKEFDLLWHFSQHPEQVFTRSQLLDSVWGYGHDGYEHTVNSHINRLRAKIENNPSQPDYILTVWGVGYKFQPAPA